MSSPAIYSAVETNKPRTVTWSSWHYSNVGVLLPFLYTATLGGIAVAEVLDHKLLSVQVWSLLSLIQIGLSTGCATLVLLAARVDLQSHLPEHADPFALAALSGVFSDAVVAVLLCVFYYNGTEVSLFNETRQSNTFPLPVRMLVAWYLCLGLLISAPVWRLRGVLRCLQRTREPLTKVYP
jgi:hypothetical protein